MTENVFDKLKLVLNHPGRSGQYTEMASKSLALDDLKGPGFKPGEVAVLFGQPQFPHRTLLIHGNLEAQSWMRQIWDAGGFATPAGSAHPKRMTNTDRLDTILAQHTAIATFAELLATDKRYVPTLDLRQCKDFILVADALVREGRDAYVTGGPNGPYFAKARFESGFQAPEVRREGMGVAITATEREKAYTEAYGCTTSEDLEARMAVLEEDDRAPWEVARDEHQAMIEQESLDAQVDPDGDELEDVGETVYNLYFEDTCDLDDPPEFACDDSFDDLDSARERAKRIRARERRDIRICEEVMEQGEVAASDTIETITRNS